MFPNEYSCSGWFKWSPLKNQKPWHLGFRLTINDKDINKNASRLGDRTLAFWVGKAGGNLHFPTYSYSNLNGAGQANLVRNIRHRNRHVKWHFIYYGYSWTSKQAYIHVKFADSDESVLIKDVNHYLGPKFWVNTAADQFNHWGYNGKMAYFAVNFGEGAFRSAKDFSHPSDIF